MISLERVHPSLRIFLKIGLGEVGRNLLLFAIGIYIAKMAGDAGFGTINFAQSIVVYLGLVVTLGTNVLGVKHVAVDPRRAGAVVSSIVALRLALAAVLFVPYAALSFKLASDLPTALIFLAVGATLFSQALNLEFAFLGLERPLALNAMRLTIPALYLAPLAAISPPGPRFWQIRLLKSPIKVGVLLAALRTLAPKRERGTPAMDAAYWRTSVREGVPIALSLFFIQVYYNFDTTVLGLTRRAEVIGWYSAAYRLVLVFLPAAAMLISAFAPEFARSYERGDKEAFRRAHRAFSLCLLGLGAAAAAVLALGAQRIGGLLFGARFVGTPEALRYLSVSLLLIFALTAFNGPLPYVGREKAYMATHLCGALVNVAVNLLLTPRLGIPGAGTASICGNLAVLVASVAAYRRFWSEFAAPVAAPRVEAEPALA